MLNNTTIHSNKNEITEFMLAIHEAFNVFAKVASVLNLNSFQHFSDRERYFQRTLVNHFGSLLTKDKQNSIATEVKRV